MSRTYPFTKEFAKLICEYYSAAFALAQAAGDVTCETSTDGMVVRVGNAHEGYRFVVKMDQELIEYAYPVLSIVNEENP